jgi:hypothetical protein
MYQCYFHELPQALLRADVKRGHLPTSENETPAAPSTPQGFQSLRGAFQDREGLAVGSGADHSE